MKFSPRSSWCCPVSCQVCFGFPPAPSAYFSFPPCGSQLSAHFFLWQSVLGSNSWWMQEFLVRFPNILKLLNHIAHEIKSLPCLRSKLCTPLSCGSDRPPVSYQEDVRRKEGFHCFQPIFQIKIWSLKLIQFSSSSHS